MQQFITAREAYDRYNALLQDCVLQIQEFAENGKIDLGENGFEDMSGNDICAIDNERVYFENTDEFYPLHQLDLLDAIKIVGDLAHMANIPA